MYFKDLKVIELSSVLAGPAVGTFFSELGAKVIKIENPNTGGDVTRSWKLPIENKDAPVSAYYSSVNWNKEVVFLDLSKADDREKVYALTADADIVIANFRPGSGAKLQMDYETFKSINPSIIYASLAGFPGNSDRPAFDVVLQAETGFMSMNGTPGSGPLKMPVALIDILAAHQLKEAILLALLHREKTGEGSLVEATLFESAIASLANQASNYLMCGHIPGPLGSEHPNIAPYGETFETRDGRKILLAIGNNSQFENLCAELGINKEIISGKFSSNKERVQHRKELFNLLSEKISVSDAGQLMEKLNSRNIPAALVKNLEEVFGSEMARQMVLGEKIDGLETKRVRTVAFKTSFIK